jgi:hypothetical protein
MTAFSIQPPYPIFTDRDGTPLENGYVWIGAANLDPQVNPIAVYWDEGLTQLAGQPIRTRGGYPSNNGTPARLYVASDYSIRVQNKNGSFLYSAPAATEAYNADVISYVGPKGQIGTVANIADLPDGADWVGFVQDGAEVLPAPLDTNRNRSVYDKLRETVSVKDFGATGDGTTDDHAAIEAAFNHCVDNEKNLYFPAGVYNVVEKNYPFKQDAVPVISLRDCKNVLVYGDGPASVLKTTSVVGADVLQINGVKNLHFHNLKITATLNGFLEAGSNGISITNGWDNLSFDHIWVEDCPYTIKPSYLDGGKAFTIQPGTPTVECGVIRATALYAKNCVYGVDVSWDLLNAATKKPAIMVEAQIEKCYVGVVFADAGGVLTGFDTNFSVNYMVRAQTINCQKDAVCNRGFGMDWNINVVANQTKAQLRQNGSGVNWSATDTVVESFRAVYARNSNFFVHGYKPDQDYKFAVGATSNTGFPGNTTNCKFVVDIGGAATTPVESVTFGGQYTDNCIMHISPVTCGGTPANIPAILYFPTLSNTIIYGANHHFTGLQVTGAVNFSYTDGIATYNSLERDPSTEGMFFKQTVGATASLMVVGAKNNAGTNIFGIRNDGYIGLASTVTAASVSTLQRVLPIYNMSNVLIGYVPIYQSYA